MLNHCSTKPKCQIFQYILSPRNYTRNKFISHAIHVVTTADEIRINRKNNWSNVNLIDENTILNKIDIQKKLQSIGNVGWYYQQFLKYKTVLSVSEEHVHIIDGDSITTEKWTRSGFLASTGKSSYKKYKYFSRLAIGFSCKQYSFVTNQMVFSKSMLKEMLDLITAERIGKDWLDILIEIITNNENAVFSEYQLYGDYIYCKKGIKPNIIKVFRRMDCINDTPDNALKKYGLIAYEPQHKTGYLRYFRANILYKLGWTLG